MRNQSWFDAEHKNSHMHHRNYETTTLFLFSIPQYIYLSLIINQTSGFRRKWYTNYLYVVFVLFWFGLSYWVIMDPTDWVRHRLRLRHLDFDFRVAIACGTVGNGALMFGWKYAIDWYYGD